MERTRCVLRGARIRVSNRRLAGIRVSLPAEPRFLVLRQGAPSVRRSMRPPAPGEAPTGPAIREFSRAVRINPPRLEKPRPGVGRRSYALWQPYARCRTSFYKCPLPYTARICRELFVSQPSGPRASCGRHWQAAADTGRAVREGGSGPRGAEVRGRGAGDASALGVAAGDVQVERRMGGVLLDCLDELLAFVGCGASGPEGRECFRGEGGGEAMGRGGEAGLVRGGEAGEAAAGLVRVTAGAGAGESGLVRAMRRLLGDGAEAAARSCRDVQGTWTVPAEKAGWCGTWRGMAGDGGGWRCVPGNSAVSACMCMHVHACGACMWRVHARACIGAYVAHACACVWRGMAGCVAASAAAPAGWPPPGSSLPAVMGSRCAGGPPGPT